MASGAASLESLSEGRFELVVVGSLAAGLAGLALGSWWALLAIPVSAAIDPPGAGGLIANQVFVMGVPMALGIAVQRDRRRRREAGSDSTNVLLARVWAHLVDLVLPYAVLAPVVGDADAGWMSGVIFIVGSAWLQSRHGWTPGKWLAGLRVQRLDGSLPSFRQAFVRSITFLFEWIGVIGLGVARASPLRQRVGDRWAGTIVRAAEAEYF